MKRTLTRIVSKCIIPAMVLGSLYFSIPSSIYAEDKKSKSFYEENKDNPLINTLEKLHNSKFGKTIEKGRKKIMDDWAVKQGTGKTLDELEQDMKDAQKKFLDSMKKDDSKTNKYDTQKRNKNYNTDRKKTRNPRLTPEEKEKLLSKYEEEGKFYCDDIPSGKWYLKLSGVSHIERHYSNYWRNNRKGGKKETRGTSRFTSDISSKYDWREGREKYRFWAYFPEGTDFLDDQKLEAKSEAHRKRAYWIKERTICKGVNQPVEETSKNKYYPYVLFKKRGSGGTNYLFGPYDSVSEAREECKWLEPYARDRLDAVGSDWAIVKLYKYKDKLSFDAEKLRKQEEERRRQEELRRQKQVEAKKLEEQRKREEYWKSVKDTYITSPLENVVDGLSSAYHWCGELISDIYHTIADFFTGKDYIEYHVKRGDTLSDIAKRETGNARNWQKIMKYNKIRNDKKFDENLNVGEKVYIPKSMLKNKK